MGLDLLTFSLWEALFTLHLLSTDFHAKIKLTKVPITLHMKNQSNNIFKIKSRLHFSDFFTLNFTLVIPRTVYKENTKNGQDEVY